MYILTSWHISRDSVKMMSYMSNVSLIPTNRYAEAIFAIGIIQKRQGVVSTPIPWESEGW